MQTASTAWLKSIGDVIEKGDRVDPRGSPTVEILNQTICFDMNYPICHHQERKLSYAFMAAEAYWITSGSMFVDEIAPYNKHIAQFSDDGHIFNGAYGPKVLNQINFVINTLLKDHTSRQAVMTIWVPNPIKTKDYACTVSLQFLIRNGKLNVIANMRSNDLWLGRPYDMFNFTIIALKILTEINATIVIDEDQDSVIRLGNMWLNAGSSHIYMKDLPRCDLMFKTPYDQLPTSKVPDMALLSWRYITDSLLACRDGVEDPVLWKIRP